MCTCCMPPYVSVYVICARGRAGQGGAAHWVRDPLQLAHLCSDVSSHVPVCVLKCARMRPDMYPYVC